MKGINTIYYLLFVLLFMGAFAAMAQNSYGVNILALVAIGFSMVFVYLLLAPGTGNKTWLRQAELILLALLAALIAARILTVQGILSDGLLLTAEAGLIIIYSAHVFGGITGNIRSRAPLPVSLFYVIAILFLLAMFFTGFRPALTGLLGIIAIALLVVWTLVAWISRKRMVSGERVTMLAQVGRSGSQVMVVVLIFLLLSLYLVFARTGIIPKIYSDSQPRAYFELVTEAESGKDKPVDGKYKYQRFKDGFENFLENSRSREQ